MEEEEDLAKIKRKRRGCPVETGEGE